MDKPIIAVTLSGLFIKSDPWKNAHILWFKDAAEKLKDNSINEWAGNADYFKGVDIVMQRLYPKLNNDERTTKARMLFFDSVIKYIKQNPSVINHNVIDYFMSIKNKYKIALITTNTKEFISKIDFTGRLFDIIEVSELTEKDDKVAVFERFIKKYGKSIIYIGGDRKDSFDYCKSNNIKCIYANLEQKGDIADVESIHSLKELMQAINSFH